MTVIMWRIFPWQVGWFGIRKYYKEKSTIKQSYSGPSQSLETTLNELHTLVQFYTKKAQHLGMKLTSATLRSKDGIGTTDDEFVQEVWN